MINAVVGCDVAIVSSNEENGNKIKKGRAEDNVKNRISRFNEWR